METTNIYSSGNHLLVAVPAGMPDLARRRAELNQMSEDDPQLLAELWRTLADEFEEIGFLTNAENCHRKAMHYAAVYARRM